MEGERSKELRELCEKATPGPWWDESGVIHACNPGVWTEQNHSCIHPVTITEPYWENALPNERQANGEFIAASRTALPEALDALEAAQREAAEAKRPCVWQHEATRMGQTSDPYYTGCDKSPRLLSTFCPSCGYPVEVKN